METEVEDIKADLNGIEWRRRSIAIYRAPNTWSFNATNLTVAIRLQKYLGMSDDEVSREDLKGLKGKTLSLGRSKGIGCQVGNNSIHWLD